MALFTTPILLATDGSEEAQLSAQAAIEMANRTDSELHLVHAWSPGGIPPSHCWALISLLSSNSTPPNRSRMSYRTQMLL